MDLDVIAKTIGALLPPGGKAFSIEIDRISSPEDADEHSIVFVADPKFRGPAIESMARVVIVKKGEAIADKICLEVSDPYLAHSRRVGTIVRRPSAYF